MPNKADGDSTHPKMDFTQESERDDDLQPAIVGTGKRYAISSAVEGFLVFPGSVYEEGAWLAMIERAVSFTVTGSGAGDAPAPFFRLKAACCGRCNQMLQSVAGRTHCCILCRKCRQGTWDVAT